jgi:hypothetical protein
MNVTFLVNYFAAKIWKLEKNTKIDQFHKFCFGTVFIEKCSLSRLILRPRLHWAVSSEFIIIWVEPISLFIQIFEAPLCLWMGCAEVNPATKFGETLHIRTQYQTANRRKLVFPTTVTISWISRELETAREITFRLTIAWTGPNQEEKQQHHRDRWTQRLLSPNQASRTPKSAQEWV